MAQEFNPAPGPFLNNGKWERKSEGGWGFDWDESAARQTAKLIKDGAVVDTFSIPERGYFWWRFLGKTEFLVLWFTSTQAPKKFRLYLYNLADRTKPRIEFSELAAHPLAYTYPEPRLVVHSSSDNKALFYYVTGTDNRTDHHRVVRTDSGAKLVGTGMILPATAIEIQRLARFTDNRRVQILTSPSSRSDGVTVWADEPLPSPSLPKVEITKVNASPKGPDVAGEYVVIRNNETVVHDLAGWVLVDNENHRYVFPNFKLGGRANVEVWTGSGTNTAERLYMGREKAVWTNTGDMARLLDASGNEVSRLQVPKGSGGHVVVPPDGAPSTPLAILEDVLVDVYESDLDVDTGVVLDEGEFCSISATGEIWAGVWFTGQNGPEGWGSTTQDKNFPLHRTTLAHPFSLLAKLGTGGDYVYAGKILNRLVNHTGEPQRVFLRINDDVPGNGSGSFRARITRYRLVDEPPQYGERTLVVEKKVRVRESDWDVDTAVDVSAGQVVECTATGRITSGVILTGESGPEGWGRLEYDPKFPLHSGDRAHPFALLGRFGDGPYFYIGASHGQRYRSVRTRRLFLRINDDKPGNGSGHFDVTIKVFDQPLLNA